MDPEIYEVEVTSYSGKDPQNYQLRPCRDPPEISLDKIQLGIPHPYDLKYIGCYLRGDLLNLTRPSLLRMGKCHTWARVCD